MKCPFCGDEMEEGLIQTMQRMAFVKRRHLVSLLPGEGEVLLGNNVFRDLTFDARICKRCKKVLLDYGNSNYEEG